MFAYKKNFGKVEQRLSPARSLHYIIQSAPVYVKMTLSVQLHENLHVSSEANEGTNIMSL